MKKLSFLTVLFLIVSKIFFAQVTINNNGNLPDPTAMLDVSSTTHGVLIPRISTAERDLIPSPATGLLIYNSTENQFNYFNGSEWVQLSGAPIPSAIGTTSPGGGVAINSLAGAQPDNSAMLDISDASRGILIPRITNAGRESILTPATGLITYCSDNNTLYYYNGFQWNTVCSFPTGVAGASGTQASTGMAINTTGASADPSAMLDVSAADKGLLIPRLSSAEREALLPVTGLTIYNTNNGTIEYYNGTSWCQVSSYLSESPAAGAQIPGENQIQWNWNTVARATGYKWNTVYDYSTATDMGANTTFLETGLACGGTYTRYVWAYNGCGYLSPVILTQTTLVCTNCGPAITINHFAGEGVAPVNKTVIYGIVSGVAGEPSKCWISKNLGASQRANAVDEASEASAGWYWQFNRKQGYRFDDTYARTPNTPWITNIDEGSDWEAANDPCTLEISCGWRIPTRTEWENVNSSGNWYGGWMGPWNSGLSLHAAGSLNYYDGSVIYRGSFGYYWSGMQADPTNGWGLYFNSSYSYVLSYNLKTSGFPVRCLRNEIIPVSAPTVTTAPASDIGENTAISGGHVTCDGGTTVTARGVCFGTSSNPSLVNSHTSDGAGTGFFSSNLSGLSPNTLYFVRAYVNNSSGTVYGTEEYFTTLAGFPCGTSLEINHAVAGGVAPVAKLLTYGTVTNISGDLSKCWITKNLGADKQADSVSEETESSAGWYWQFNRKQGYMNDGVTVTPAWQFNHPFDYLDWQPENDPCLSEIGNSWHIPTYTEWTDVSNLGNWSVAGPYNTDLKLHAAGYLYAYSGSVNNRGFAGYYWSSNQTDMYNGGSLDLGSSFGYASNNFKQHGLTLRCIRNISAAVTTAVVSNIGSVDATSGGEVSSDGGSAVTARGICWSTTSPPTIANDHTIDGNGTGGFVSILTGLIPNTQYFVRAYATNGLGTIYGNMVTFTTIEFVCGASFTINHLVGDVAPVAKTVTYGTVTNIPGDFTHCWITRNLGAGKQADSVNEPSEAAAGWYWQFNRQQGFQLEENLNRTPSNTWITQIIENTEWQAANDPCTIELGPNWRIPTYYEWASLIWSGSFANWNDAFASGLRLHAAGNLYYSGGYLTDRGQNGFYWTSSQDTESQANYFGLYSGYCYVTGTDKAFGFPLRCISNN